ncbi:MAG: hypothetical protein LVQ96_04055 [Thermoplasmatales archaeon]|nr:hypothetical protein [Thermoplasmatales archaeon]
MNNSFTHPKSLGTLEGFTNDALRLKHYSDYLNRFNFNRESIKIMDSATYI